MCRLDITYENPYHELQTLHLFEGEGGIFTQANPCFQRGKLKEYNFLKCMQPATIED